MKSTFEAGTELVIDSEVVPFQLNWLDEGSEVFRCGPQVTVAIRVTEIVAEAWAKGKYKKGERATEGGHVYEAIVAETDEAKPSTKPLDWKDLGPTPSEPTHVCTLPVEYRPASPQAGLGSGSLALATDGKVTGTSGKETGLFIFRAAGGSP